ncbi:MAG: hypothetical protein NDJ19_06300 [Ramlibacter sp.]|nr:hypothetical protein [Ramlibacter sp.]
MRLVLVCAALAAAPAIAGDMVARHGGDSVRLGEGPCTSERVLGRLEPKLHPHFRAASAVVQGNNFAACWRKTGSVAVLLYEDGDQGIVPLADLKPELSA